MSKKTFSTFHTHINDKYTYPLSLDKNLWVETTVEWVVFCEQLGGAVEFLPSASVWPLIVVLTLAVAARTGHFVPLPC